MNTNEMIELEELALTEDQQAAVKGGPLMSVTDLVIDPFNVNRSGTGTLVLAGANTYTGQTTVNSGAALHLKPLAQ